MKKTAVILGSIMAVLLLVLLAVFFFNIESRPGTTPVIVSTSYEQRYAQAAHEADTWLRETYLDTPLPSISVAVGVDGKLVWAGAIGYADLDNAIQATPEHLYRIGSISKALTATALIRLQQEGALDIEMTFQQLVPDYAIKTPFTLKQLATHQAGIRHYRDGLAGDLEAFRQRTYSSRQGAGIVEHDELLFEPGSQRSYSTYGYTLLALGMERATRRQYQEIMTNEVFGPAGMYESFVDVNGMTHATSTSYYILAGQQNVKSPPTNHSYKYAGGGILSTASDLVRFGNGLLNTTLVNQASRDRLWTPVALADGSLAAESYGLGFYIREGSLGQVINHTGSVPGGYGQFSIYPDKRVVIALLSNTTVLGYVFNPAEEFPKLAKIFIE